MVVRYASSLRVAWQSFWALSILDTVDDYSKYTENDVLTFFLAFDVFNDIINQFDRLSAGATNIFCKTLQEGVFTGDIVKNKDDYKLTKFIRALSVAHTAEVDNGEGFLQKDRTFTLLRIDTISAVPTDVEIANPPKAFYFHVVLSRKDKDDGESVIFKVFIDELKDYLKTKYENCDFKKLKG